MFTKSVRYVFFLLVLLSFSCSRRIPLAQQVGERFYNFLMLQHYDQVVMLIDDSTLKKVPANEWITGLKSIQTERGVITKFYPTKVELYKDNEGNVIVVLSYKVFYENLKSYDDKLYLIFREKSQPPKIIKYEYAK